MIDEDTIAAIATPFGTGGIGIIKISGPKSFEIAKKIFRRKAQSSALKPYHLHYGEVIDTQDGSVIDEALLSFMQKPTSYTKEDVVEINCHSGFLVLQKVLEIVLKEGGRLAEPGEFTKRSFINGRIDLSQAEAVVDIVNSQTNASLRVATQQLKGVLSKEVMKLKEGLSNVLTCIEASIDFSEEDIDIIPPHELLNKIKGLMDNIRRLIDSYEEGRFYREGISAIIIGKPNVGKSSLLNALLKEKRAIVTSIPGTTRDIIEEGINVKGFPLKIIDTAGMGDTKDVIEEEGIRLAKEKLASADLVILVIDSSQELDQGDFDIIAELFDKKVIVALNKIDLIQESSISKAKDKLKNYSIVPISALYSQGIEELKEAVFSAIIQHKLESPPSVFITNIRHKIALEKALDNLAHAEESLIKEMSPEFTALDIQLSLKCLGEIVGETTSDDILDRIFSEFCIGK
ncbi:MAG: tRNA uridine-5-carboxymethylaminomethyl(34) synthesis GTPase MnmE [Deltaproteobacteria bacterium CG12_big_fil_rev_8_21_14_0_65_43_10]|nr:MAG: tRNA uridine-5-carboxymethylaminomethyl(34) synthesis GTPase MnmE [Deltaproteobacteria bacterium CG12_big_fil_rev_8_21_14_0_65_43_10]